MTQAIEEKNKAFVLEAFETLFNKRDYAAAERFWSSNYIQHFAHIPPGREGLFALIKGAPEALRYENGLAVSHGDYVWLHGRFSGLGLPADWIVVDIVRIENGQMAEQLRVSHPGVDNTIEAILMGAIASVQVLLFALGAAGVRPLAIFNNTEFLMLTVISMTQAIVAILINARTLRRTIGVGDNG